MLPYPPVSRRHRACGGVLLSVPVLLLAGAALASGTRVGFKDAFALARGNAFVATADNPAAIYYNPAGLTQLDGTRVSASVYDVRLSSDYRGAAGAATMIERYQAVPQAFFTWHRKGERWAYGLGTYAPFGLSTEWPAGRATVPPSPLRTLATKNEERFTTLNPVVAWQVSDALSVGGGLTFNHLKVELRRELGITSALTDLLRFNARGDAVGFNAGLLWKPAAEHAFGLSYQHHTSFKLDGTTDTVPLVPGPEPSASRFAFPEVVIVGYSYRPAPQWNLEINLDWTNWDRVKTFVITKPTGPLPLAFNWRSGCFYEFGATRWLGARWHVSAGYLFTPDSTPDATFTPAVPDCDRSFYSLGVGYSTPRLAATLAWHYGDGGTRTVRGSPLSLIGATADGTYHNALTAFALSVEVRF
jgi:long-chain fatty acid transport protein